METMQLVRNYWRSVRSSHRDTVDDKNPAPLQAGGPHTPRVAVGGLRPPTPLRKVGLRPPWALGPIWDGALGPMGPGPRVDLELFGPKMDFWKIEKQEGARLGPRWAHLG